MDKATDIGNVTAEQFEALLGEEFRAGDARFTLLSVDRHHAGTLPRARRTHFSLLLQQSAGETVDTGEHPLEHPRLRLAQAVMLNRVMPPPEYVTPGQFDTRAYFDVIFN